MTRPLEPIVGVLGGMGPKATIDFVDTLLSLTEARADQDHVRMFIDSNPTVPDRTAHLLGEGSSPLPHLLQMARQLEKGGASLLVMPCNTAHAYFSELEKAVDIPFLDMIRVTAASVAQRFSVGRTVGLLATRGTIRAGLYQRALLDQGRPDVLLPGSDGQMEVQAAIERVKAGNVHAAAELLAPVIRSLRERGASLFLLGCSEIPLITETAFPELEVVNATRCLAEATLKQVMQLKPVA